MLEKPEVREEESHPHLPVPVLIGVKAQDQPEAEAGRDLPQDLEPGPDQGLDPSRGLGQDLGQDPDPNPDQDLDQGH